MTQRFVPARGPGPNPYSAGEIRQNDLVDVLLRSLISTGTPQLNDDEHDLWPYGIGIAFPADWIDIDSFEAMRAAASVPLQQVLWWDEPEAIGDFFSEVLSALGFIGVWDHRNQQFRVVPKSLPTAASSVTTLTDDDRTPTTSRLSMTFDPAGIISGWNVAIGLDGDGDPIRTLVVPNGKTFSRTGEQRVEEIRARWTGGGPFAVGTFVNGLRQSGAFHDRAWARLSFTVDRASGARFTAGDDVLLSFGDLQDFTTGEFGATDLPAKVISVAPSQNTQTLDVVAVAWPDVTAKAWGTSAQVDDEAIGGGLSLPGGGVADLKVRAGLYGASEVNDFKVGDVVLVAQWWDLDPTTIGQKWLVTIVAINTLTNTITVDDTLAGFVPGNEYAIIEANYGDVISSQRLQHAFVGDEADQQIVDLAPLDVYA